MPPAKQMPREDVEAVEQWIRSGAEWPASDLTSKFTITPEQRAHWAFQPLKSKRDRIDTFIDEKLRAKNLTPAPPASRRVLIRRVFFDLWGLPPIAEEIEAFVNDKSPNAFEKVIDRLLASPRYGERWARHWMDVVRYADTAGDSADYPIPQMYKYRDWLIQAFNNDKPYDQFVREQLAGDLMPAQNDEEKWARTVATGYVASTRRFSVNPERQMHLSYDDTIDNVGKAFLGLSVSCARCHDHKYDPISNKDYYALYGIFASTRYPFAGSEQRNYQTDLIARQPQEKVEELKAPHRAALEAIEAEIKILDELTARHRQRFDALRKGENPPPIEKKLPTRGDYNNWHRKRAAILTSLPVELAFAVTEDKPKDAPVLIRGELNQPGDIVPRRFVEVLGGQSLQNSDRSGRLELAEWIVSHPLTARVMANRIWQYHFGKGLVTTPNDFGKRGSAPTHPELLDYLASTFKQGGWSMKAMHKHIMLSQAYQRASDGPVENANIDPANALLWKFDRRKLDAESLRDSLLALSGQLHLDMGGEHPFPVQSTWNYEQHRPFQGVYDHRRRSVYLMTQRFQRHPYLSMFDGADTNASTPVRPPSVTPIQALFQMNSELMEEASEGFAGRLIERYQDDRSRIDAAHRNAIGRPATADELAKAPDYLSKAQAALAKAGVPEKDHRMKALASYLRALLASNDFMFVD